jgi:hypothetical protein
MSKMGNCKNCFEKFRKERIWETGGRWQNNIKILARTGVWLWTKLTLTQLRFQWQAFENFPINFGLIKVDNFIINWISATYSRNALNHGVIYMTQLSPGGHQNSPWFLSSGASSGKVSAFENLFSWLKLFLILPDPSLKPPLLAPLHSFEQCDY